MSAEIQGPGSFWTLLHLAARWDAVRCISYLLRKFFQEDALNYVSFVNSQTAEGFTALMLTIIWGSSKCFSVLMKFGGCDLSVRDGRLIDVFSHALSYGRKQCLDRLNKLWDQGVVIMPVKTNRLMRLASLQQILVNPGKPHEVSEAESEGDKEKKSEKPKSEKKDPNKLELKNKVKVKEVEQVKVEGRGGKKRPKPQYEEEP